MTRMNCVAKPWGKNSDPEKQESSIILDHMNERFKRFAVFLYAGSCNSRALFSPHRPWAAAWPEEADPFPFLRPQQ
jgi:hypothetical protein